MKRSYLIIGILYILAGIIFLLIVLFTQTRLEGLFSGFAGAGIGPGLFMVYRYFYWNRPTKKEEYEKRMEQERIELHDELKEKVRGKTAQYVYALGLCVISVSTVLFAVLDSMEILENSDIFVFYLVGYLVVQIVGGHLIFRHLMKKY